MGNAGHAVEPPQRVALGGRPQPQQRHQRRERHQREQPETDSAAQRRQNAPQADPRHRQEQADHGGERRQRRPDTLPQQRAARALQRLRQSRAERCRWRCLSIPSALVLTVQSPLRRPGRTVPGDRGQNPSAQLTLFQPAIQGGSRSSAINWSASRRGRTSAHRSSRTSTSGTSARVL